jgi:hypothetical protein
MAIYGMSLRSRRPEIFVAAAIFAIVAAVKGNEARNSPIEKGTSFLKSSGYTNVTGGGWDFINGCGNGVFARSYEVTNSKNERESKTVCFNYTTYLAPY